MEELSDFVPLTNYRIERKFAIFSKLDACSFVDYVYDQGNILSVVADSSPHGTHVAGIAIYNFSPKGNMPLPFENNILSLCIWNITFYKSHCWMELHPKVILSPYFSSCLSLCFASCLAKLCFERSRHWLCDMCNYFYWWTSILELICCWIYFDDGYCAFYLQHKCDLIHMSKGEPTKLHGYERFVDLVNEVWISKLDIWLLTWQFTNSSLSLIFHVVSIKSWWQCLLEIRG